MAGCDPRMTNSKSTEFLATMKAAMLKMRTILDNAEDSESTRKCYESQYGVVIYMAGYEPLETVKDLLVKLEMNNLAVMQNRLEDKQDRIQQCEDIVTDFKDGWITVEEDLAKEKSGLEKLNNQLTSMNDQLERKISLFEEEGDNELSAEEEDCLTELENLSIEAEYLLEKTRELLTQKENFQSDMNNRIGELEALLQKANHALEVAADSIGEADALLQKIKNMY